MPAITSISAILLIFKKIRIKIDSDTIKPTKIYFKCCSRRVGCQLISLLLLQITTIDPG